MDIPDDNEPLLTISVAAQRLGVSESLLRLYEREGMLLCARTSSGRRLYSIGDLRLMGCVRTLIRDHGLNFAGVRALFSQIPCWEIKNCSPAERAQCNRFRVGLIPCWLLEETGCGVRKGACRECPVYAAASKVTEREPLGGR